MKLVGVLEENEGEETDINNTVSTVNSCSVSASNNNTKYYHVVGLHYPHDHDHPPPGGCK